MEPSGKRTSFLGQSEDKPGEGPDTIASLRKENKLIKKKVLAEREEKQVLLSNLKSTEEQVVSLQASISDYKGQIQSWTDSSSKLTQKLSLLEQEKAALVTQVTDLTLQKTLATAYESTISSLRQTVSDYEAKVRTLEGTRQTLTQELDQVKQDCEAVGQVNGVLHSQLAVAKEKEKQWVAADEARNRSLKELEEKSRESDRKAAQSDREKSSFAAEAASLKEKLANSLEETKKMMQIVESLKSEKQSFETIRGFLEEKIDAQKVSLEESKQEKAQLIEQLQSALHAFSSGKTAEEGTTDNSLELQQAKIEMKFKSQQLAELEEKHRKVKAAKEEAAKEMHALKRDIEAMTLSAAELNADLKSKNKELEAANAQIATNADLAMKFGQLGGTVVELERTNTELSRQLKERQTELEKLIGEMKAKNDGLIKLDMQLKSESEAGNKLRQQLKEKDDTVLTLTTQLRDIQVASEARKSQITNLEDTISKLKSEREELSTAFLSHKDASNQSDSKFQQLREQFSVMDQKAKIAESQFEVTKSALKIAEQNNDTLQKLLESASTKVTTLEAALAKLKEDYDSSTMNSQLIIDKLQKQAELSQEEISSLRSSIKSMKVHKSELEATIASQLEEIASLTTTLDNSEPELRKQVEHLKSKVVEQFKKLESTNKDYQDCCKSKVNLIEVNSRLEEDLDRTRMDLRDKMKLLDITLIENTEKSAIIEALKDALSRHAETEALLANQIMELKNKLMESQSYFLRFDVVKVSTLQHTAARLTLRRMPAGTHVLDIEIKGTISTYYDKMLENVAQHASKSNRFLIKVVNESNKEFESVEAEAIVKAVRKFMFPQVPTEYAME